MSTQQECVNEFDNYKPSEGQDTNHRIFSILTGLFQKHYIHASILEKTQEKT